jgi:hypothetical protein
MTKRFFATALAATFFISLTATAQIRDIPKEVQQTFERQYPMATQVEFKDQLVRIDVQFILDSNRYVAMYSNKGVWKETDKEWSFDQLPEDVQSGFEKSKYADDEWDVKETVVVYLPGGGEQYRIKVEKNELQKKYLFFNKKGRLIRDSITL